MGYFQVRYDSRDVIYDRRAFIRLTSELVLLRKCELIIRAGLFIWLISEVFFVPAFVDDNVVL